MTEALELRRLTDKIVYRFQRVFDPSGVSYKREDKDLYLTWREGFGWGAWDGETLHGRPWNVQLSQQSVENPPEGLWVSQKGTKSYSYKLVHIDNSENYNRYV